MRSCVLLLAFVAGCHSCQKVSYATRPGCASCGSDAAARFGPLRPVPATSPPAFETPRPPATAAEPPVRLGEPRLKAEFRAAPDASIPKPDDETPPAIDLPGFAVARPGVASGLQPFADGQDWLARKGYKTALHLRGPLDDSAAAKRQFEKKGINYVSLSVSPATLTLETAQEFSRIVTDEKAQPLFVYDKDGSAAGALWYLHHRLYLKSDDETARKEATRLGLRDDDEEHKTMWVAVQALLKRAGRE